MELLKKLEKPLPRYTSYPPVPIWSEQSHAVHKNELEKAKGPLSLYIHIPFCERMCLFCGCNVVLNRKVENEIRYIDYLLKEIDLVCGHLHEPRPKIAELHLGGGTPTKLSKELIFRLIQKLQSSFDFDTCEEMVVEVDPRTIYSSPDLLLFLKNLGFNRLSFGVQDIDPKVQKAIARDQTLEMTQNAIKEARSHGFKEINIDLIYGLPFQTLMSFKKTIDAILELKPDRIAFFSYAKVPHIKPHQRAIKDETLPSSDEKFNIYTLARKAFIEAGYLAIGMDHFALMHTQLALSYHNKTLTRNFQGFAVRRANKLLGLGVSAISDLGMSYFQNQKELLSYYLALDKNELPTHKGFLLSTDDELHRWVLFSMMQRFEIDKREFFDRYQKDFNLYFSDLNACLQELQDEGLIVNERDKLSATKLGELFSRNIASCFDAYLVNTPFRKYSSSI